MGSYADACDAFYWRARAKILPDLLNSQYQYRNSLRAALTGCGRWLDLGCGHDVLPAWFRSDEKRLEMGQWKLVGLDFDRSALSKHTALRWAINGDVQQLPFRPNTFDLVTANMVVEHVAEPKFLFQEVARVLTPGGKFIIHTPNGHGYSTLLTKLLPTRFVAPLAGALLGRAAEDVYPAYYRANTRRDIERFSDAAGLRLDGVAYVESTPQTIRIPPVMLGELALIRLLRADRLSARRACILATLSK